jgi:hypothetical protein
MNVHGKESSYSTFFLPYNIDRYDSVKQQPTDTVMDQTVQPHNIPKGWLGIG